MAVQIGATPDSGYDNPLGMLQDCHRRIERFLGILHQIGTSIIERALTAEEISAVEAALRYFRTAGPKHNADEEESVFPRIRSGITAEELEQIDRLERDHDHAALLHDSVDLLFSSWIANHELRPKDQLLLRENLEQLQSIYTEHIRLEETVIFPLAVQRLSHEAIETIGQEFKQRRK
jgi:hemerythrin-like domain-containing protein